MTVEADIFSTLSPVAATKVYPDTAPGGVTPSYITYQQVGGRSFAFLEGGAAPSKKHGRFQVNCWATTRLAAAALALAADNALRAATAFRAEPISEPVALNEETLGYYGTQQDFSVWSDR